MAKGSQEKLTAAIISQRQISSNLGRLAHENYFRGGIELEDVDNDSSRRHTEHIVAASEDLTFEQMLAAHTAADLADKQR